VRDKEEFIGLHRICKQAAYSLEHAIFAIEDVTGISKPIDLFSFIFWKEIN